MPRTWPRQRPMPPITIPPTAAELATAPWPAPPPPIATGARILRYHTGPCALCRYAMLAGDRVADLADGTGTAHVSCIGGAR